MNRTQLNLRFSLILLLFGNLLLAAVLPVEIAIAQGATFPDEPFNGLQITYSVSGAKLAPPADNFSFTTARAYIGSLSDKTLTVSGTVTAKNGWGADLSVTAWIGKDSKDFKASKHPKNGLADDPFKQDFSVTVTTDQFSLVSEAGFSINLAGSYNAGGRAVVVSGKFRGPLVDLCEEAKVFFNENELSFAGATSTGTYKGKNIQMDFKEMNADLAKALLTYKEDAKRMGLPEAYIPTNLLGTLPALTWLFAEGGVMETVSKQYVFNKDGIDALKPNYQVKHGTEPALAEAIRLQAEREKKPLTPGDVFRLAMIQADGNVRNANLLAHNTLRSLARSGDNGLTGVQPDSKYYTKPAGTTETVPPYLTTIREGDNAGPWYHLFGTAFFEIESRGQLGPITNLMEMLSSNSYDISPEMRRKLFDIVTGPDETKQSDLTNILEQYYRQWLGGRNPDIEKFCFNVWGAQLGAWMWNSIPKSGVDTSTATIAKEYVTIAGKWVWRQGADLYSNLKGWYNSTGNPKATETVKNTGPLQMPLKVAPKPIMGGTGSPVNVTWESADGRQMVLDQKTASVYGFYPMKFMPVIEKDGTWGTLWSVPPGANVKLKFEGTADGKLNIFMVDPITSKAAIYKAPIKPGEKFSMQLDTTKPSPALVKEDGSSLQPVLITVDLTKPVESSNTTSAGDTPWILYGVLAAAGGFGLLLVVVSLILLLRRNKPRRMG